MPASTQRLGPSERELPVARADAGNEMPAIGRHRLRREEYQRVGLSVHLFGEANRLYMSICNGLSEKVLTKSTWFFIGLNTKIAKVAKALFRSLWMRRLI